MKRIGILTFQRTLNYGAALQCYALQTILQDLDVEASVIDYECKAVENKEFPLSRGFSMKSLARQFLLRKKIRAFSRFREKLNLGSRCNRSNVSEACAELDAVVVGSDQVWNPHCTGGDLTFFLDFIDESQKKKSYAASLGKPRFPQDGNDYGALLDNFSSCLVREQVTAEAVTAATEGAVQPHVVLDPTLLLDPSKWDDLIEGASPCNPGGTLAYVVSETNKTIEAARKLGEQNGNEVSAIHPYRRPIEGVSTCSGLSPESFVASFKHAKSVVVSSFHGVCFAIVFHKDFYYALRTAKDNSNDRITDLLDTLGIRNRSADDLLSGKAIAIDWESVDKRLLELRRDSLELLKQGLKKR